MRWLYGCLIATAVPLSEARAGEPSAAERGYKALTTTTFIPAMWREKAYGDAWKRWPGVTERPADYDAAFRDYYGLPAAPYPNHHYPMGLRKGTLLIVPGVAVDCMLCHGGSIMGKSYIGLGNASLDIQALFEDLSAADGRAPRTPFPFGHVRGTTEAGSFAVFLLGFRDPDLKFRSYTDLGLQPNQCEDTPAWWLLKKKKTMYHTGGADARSIRSKMQFMLLPPNGLAEFEKHEPAFRDIHEYILSIPAPKYPGPVDAPLAARGEQLFRTNCSECHGTYGEKWTYPNRIIPLDEIGTDPNRYEGISRKFGEAYNASWFAREKRPDASGGYPVQETKGYQAPPLDGIWATAPYLHNGSVPTVYHVLNSKARPSRFTRSYRTNDADYDHQRLGWKFTELRDPPDPKLHPREQRRIYDTSQPGRSNRGHTYGDHLSDAERMAIIESLKTRFRRLGRHETP